MITEIIADNLIMLDKRSDFHLGEEHGNPVSGSDIPSDEEPEKLPE